MKKIAVVLCGSGYKDGSEIRESVATLYAIEKLGHQWQAFAPDDWQKDVINCQSGKPLEGEKRNMLVESARITRGQSKDLKNLHVENFDLLVLPGGFGAAKNLCTFAKDGVLGHVHPELLRVLKGFYEAQKPIVAICIAPAILAMALPNSGIQITLGAEGETSQEFRNLGIDVVPVTSAKDFVQDKKHRIYTTPAYMFDDATLPEIFKGIEDCIRAAI